MPIFEFKCEECGEKFEKLVYSNEEICCPKCGSKNLKKLISLFATSGIEQGSSGCSSCSGGNCSSCH
jgi:putative FmdB family regulatory protein